MDGDDDSNDEHRYDNDDVVALCLSHETMLGLVYGYSK